MNLKEWRESKGWDQADLAAKIGKPRPTYQKMEAGAAPIRQKEQDKIRKLGFTGSWPERNAEITRADVESLRAEVRNQATWLREELRKENATLAADLEKALAQLAGLRDTFSRATS